MLSLFYPNTPPSLNSLYRTNPKTGVIYLVKEGKAFKEEFYKFGKENWLSHIHSFDTEAPYRVTYEFYFPREKVLNDKFGIDKRIKSRYKKFDVDNLLKIVTDSLAYVFGFNDSHIISVKASKLISEKKGVQITLEKCAEEDFIVDS